MAIKTEIEAITKANLTISHSRKPADAAEFPGDVVLAADVPCVDEAGDSVALEGFETTVAAALVEAMLDTAGASEENAAPSAVVVAAEPSAVVVAAEPSLENAAGAGLVGSATGDEVRAGAPPSELLMQKLSPIPFMPQLCRGGRQPMAPPQQRQ